jgi:hypothetical protein
MLLFSLAFFDFYRKSHGKQEKVSGATGFA